MTCTELLAILSPDAVESNNFMDEVAYALEEGKTVIPIMHCDNRIPMRLLRLNYVDFRSDYDRAIHKLLRALAGEGQVTSDWIPTPSSALRSRDSQHEPFNAEQEQIEREKAKTAQKA